MVRSVAIAVAIAVSFLAPPAAADSLEEARQAFRDGAEAAKGGRWGDALTHFGRSSALRPHAATTYNRGYCELMLGRPAIARRLLTRALAEDDARPGQLGELRASAEHHLAASEKAVARISIVAPAGTRVTIDGRPLELERQGPPALLSGGTREPGPAEPLPAGSVEIIVDPGQRSVEVRRPGDTAPKQHALTLQSGARAELVVPAEAPKAAPVAEQPGLMGQKRAAIVLAGLGGASFVVGGVLAGVAGGHWGDAQDACPDPSFCPDSTGPELAEDALAEANAATVAFVVGGLAVAGAAALWLTAPDPFGRSESDTKVAVDGRGVRITWGF
jgi:hypothetical protein